MYHFQSKTVIVTGSGAGMGQSVAILFAQQGANVIVNSRSTHGQATCDTIISQGGKALFVQGDVSREEVCREIVEKAAQAFGGIDVLVNAAGIVVSGSVEDAQLEDWDMSMNVNAKSVLLMCRFAMPYLRASKGSIVNVASTVALKGVKNRAIYSASKGAVVALSQSMAAEYVAQGIRVNCVSPGTVDSPSFRERVQQSPNPELAMRQFVERQPMGRLGSSEEVAKAILFASATDVGFMTGANIVVDGGMTL